MSENNSVTRKIFRGILIFLKWTFVLALTVLLIAGLYFQAPWKVLGVIMIFLFALTILPKRSRKYFWITTACLVTALVIWVLLPDDNTGWKPYTCQKEIEAINDKYNIPDDENAAVIYTRLLDNVDKDELSFNFDDYSIGDKVKKSPWQSSDHPKLAKWLAGHRETIKMLSDAAKRDKCFFPYANNADVMEDIMPRISQLRACSRLLMMAAQNDFGHDRNSEAFDKYRTIMKMSDHLYHNNSLIELLVSVGIEAEVYGFVNDYIMDSQPTEADIRAIEAIRAIRKHDWQKAWKAAADTEKLLYYKTLYREYEVNEQGKLRFARNLIIDLPPELLELLGKNSTPGYWTKRRYKLSAFLSWFWLPTDPEVAGAGLEKFYKRYYEMTEDDWRGDPKEFSFKSIKLRFPDALEFYSYISDPGLYKVFQLHCRIISHQKATAIILAIKDYHNENGSWPQSLDLLGLPPDLLIDAVNNRPFAYKLTEDEFTLDSIGIDLIDDDGKQRTTYHADGTKTVYDDFRFWPRKGRAKDSETSGPKPGMMPGMPGMPGFDPNMMPGMPGMPGLMPGIGGMPGMPADEAN